MRLGEGSAGILPASCPRHMQDSRAGTPAPPVISTASTLSAVTPIAPLNFGALTGAAYADGDIDGDGDVDIADLAPLLASFGQVPGCD